MLWPKREQRFPQNREGMVWGGLRGHPRGPVGRSLRFRQFYHGNLNLAYESRLFYNRKVDVGQESIQFYNGKGDIGARIPDTLVNFDGKWRL